jgi:hypothetical protein
VHPFVPSPARSEFGAAYAPPPAYGAGEGTLLAAAPRVADGKKPDARLRALPSAALLRMPSSSTSSSISHG